MPDKPGGLCFLGLDNRGRIDVQVKTRRVHPGDYDADWLLSGNAQGVPLMVTLREVANIAKVNVSTVSRFLSGQLRVKPETERRIRSAMALTGYRPNAIARSLRQGRTNILAVIVPDIYQPGLSGIVAGIDKIISGTAYTLILLMTSNDIDREQEALNTVLEMMIDGVVIVGRAFGPNQVHDYWDDESNVRLAAMKRAGIPVTFVSRNSSRSTYSEVCPDQESGGHMLARHLLDRGWRFLGMVVGSREHPSDAAKIQGFRRALVEADIAFRDDMVVEAHFRQENVPVATERLLRQGIDAVLCSSDLMAVAALKHLREVGLSVPGDIAVAGYGGTYWADSVTPRLTTVDVGLEQMGEEAAAMLLGILGGETEAPTFKVMPVELRVGEST